MKLQIRVDDDGVIEDAKQVQNNEFLPEAITTLQRFLYCEFQQLHR